jgi:hypothetical protein
MRMKDLHGGSTVSFQFLSCSFFPRLGFPLDHQGHQTWMFCELQTKIPLAIGQYLRTPAEPSPPPIKEPPTPMENPDAPIREPEPDEPTQI